MLEQARYKAAELLVEGMKRMDTAFSLGMQAGSDVIDTCGHYGSEAMNLVINRALSVETIKTILALVDREQDGFDDYRQFVEEDLGVPAIYYEMLEGTKVIENMPEHFAQICKITGEIYGHCAHAGKQEGLHGPRPSRIYVAGEGSSIAMPGALASKFGEEFGKVPVINKPAAEIKDVCKGDTVILLSNGGTTDTAIALAKQAKDVGAVVVGITMDGESPLAEVCGEENTIVFNCGPEEVVGATKTVVEQCLIVSQIIRGLNGHMRRRDRNAFAGQCKNAKKGKGSMSDLTSEAERMLAGDRAPLDYENLANLYRNALTQPIPQDIIRTISMARELVIIGGEGVHREAALKVAETIGVKVRLIDTSFTLHGDAETMNDRDVVLILEPNTDKIKKIEKKISARVPVFYFGSKLGDFENKLPHGRVIRTPREDNFQSIMDLGVLQNLFVRLAVYKGSKCQPKIADKVGDPIEVTAKTQAQVAAAVPKEGAA